MRAALQTELLAADMAEMFVAEFQREVARLTKASRDAERRLQAIDAELAALSRNLLAGVVGPTIMTMIAKREAEREARAASLAARSKPIRADVVPHPVLLRRFAEKIARLRQAPGDEAVHGRAVAMSRNLLDSVTTDADPVGGPTSADVFPPFGKLLRYAQNAENPRRITGMGCSVVVVAGTGFEPVTFRL